MTFEGTLLFALNTVGLAFVFFSHDGPPYRHTLRASGASRASVRTRAPYPRALASGRINAHFCLKFAESRGIMGVMSEFLAYPLRQIAPLGSCPQPRFKAFQEGFGALTPIKALKIAVEVGSMAWHA